MKRTEPLLILGAAVLAAGGLALQLLYGWDAFPRAGALIVAYGVALAGREIFLNERAISNHESRVESLEAAYLDAMKQDGEGDPRADFSRLAENLKGFRISRLDRTGRLINIEIAIVCVGTLIWGFGDLVG